ncbi:MAG: hypothetical protein ACJA0S_001368 [Rickettsiales bacterium]|jgi:hypothetical protein
MKDLMDYRRLERHNKSEEHNIDHRHNMDIDFVGAWHMDCCSVLSLAAGNCKGYLCSFAFVAVERSSFVFGEPDYIVVDIDFHFRRSTHSKQPKPEKLIIALI